MLVRVFMSIRKRNFWAQTRHIVCLTIALLVGFGATLAQLSEAMAESRIKAAIIVDANTNGVLYAQAADVLRSPASLTKIMTLYVLFAYMRAGKVNEDTNFKVTAHSARQAPTKLGLKPGSTIKVRDCIKALVTKSANDAAAVIAENLGGTEANFARIMTQTARNLGMKNTTFRNASGLPNKEQLTTARDMAILAMHVMRDYPEYYGVFESRYFTYKGRKYRNHNRLLFTYKGTDGIKTGYTRGSGFNLTASVHRNNKHLVGVVLGGRTGAQRDAALRSLFDRHWAKAKTGKPKSTSFVASLLAPPAPPRPSRKPRFALAGAAAAPVTRSPAAPAAVVAQGDASAPGDSVRTVGARTAGNYHVQVGSYTAQSDAQNRLGMVRQRASKLLHGHLPFTATFVKDDTEWYRARFAGFSKPDARSTCEALQRMRLDCIAMAAE